MDQTRGRSPSAGHHAHISRGPSPSPHASFQNNVPGLEFDPSLSNNPANFATTSAAFDSSQYLTTSQPQQFPQQTALDQSFLQATQAISQHNTPHFGPQGNNISPDPLDLTNNNNNVANPDFNSFFAGNDLDQNQALPSYLGTTLDPHLLDSQSQQQQFNADLMSSMATTQAHSPTPPHLLPTMSHQQQSPSPHASPNMNQSAFPPPSHQHQRNASASLDPSAAYGQQGNEWGNMASFRGHRRAPSETYSDVSSAHASPYLVQQDSFEDVQPSPLLNPQADPQLFHDPVAQFNQFSLNENNAHISPGHSPHISPRLMPAQQSLPQFQPDSFGLGQNNMHNQFGQQPMGAYPGQGAEPFPSLNQPVPEFGHADAMSPPEINIDFAPPSRQASFEPPKPEHQTDALSPPDRCELSTIKHKIHLLIDSSPQPQSHACQV